ncbi:MAG: helix-turn-helix transcriptional regulator [Paludibacterium sp.]|uniref:helix-turn-helix domain-containing protein n=1 Tax=Paludibacterium sp. TaxID=1917523 RepID=UPI0025FC3AE8|nr:helix-turn-helix transcriptional regulator [Paludibacterium sp.]MBV8046921.1 helix-turn-helix transcriptional regulator [Paludibacterium sp.]MBV8646367.1 helix-turn-helix transcriptional regulator [Paludibacterium sp.]
MPRRNLTKLCPLPIHAQFALNALGERITLARKERGLTQSEVADMLGISKTTYVSIEHGSNATQIGHYARAIFLLDVPGTFLPAPQDAVFEIARKSR